MKQLAQLAKVIRSKNAGPFLSTIDFFFDDEEYKLVRDSNVLTVERVAAQLHVPLSDVVRIQCLDAARGVKITVTKPDAIASGDPGCTDVFGAQQYIPLLSLEFPVE